MLAWLASLSSSCGVTGEIPHHPGWPIAGNAFALWRAPLETLAASVVDRDVVRLRVFHEKVVFVNDPACVRHVLVDHPRGYSRAQSVEAPGLRELLGDNLLTTDGPTWIRYRRLQAPAFRREAVDAMIGRSLVTAARQLDAWQAHAGKRIELFPRVLELTAAVSATAFLDADLGPADNGAFVRAILEGQRYVYERGVNPFSPPLSIPTPRNLRMRRAVGGLARLVDHAMTRAEAGADNLLSLLASHRTPDTGVALGAREVRDQLMTMLVAGAENVTNALCWALYLLDRNPGARARAVAEIDGVLAKRPPTVADAEAFPFLRRVVKETLRLYPVAWFFARRVLEDTLMCGHPIRRGDLVVLCPWVTHRSRRWWPDPEAFDPDRFLAASPAREALAYFPFGAGPRQCIGDRFAIALVELLLAMVLQRYEPRVAGGPIAPQTFVSLRPRGGLPAVLGARNGAITEVTKDRFEDKVS